MTTATNAFPKPTRGASLLLAFRLEDKATLIIGGTTLAATRAFAALESGSRVVVLVRGGAEAACEELRWRAQQCEVEILDSSNASSLFSTEPSSSTGNAEEDEFTAVKATLEGPLGPFSLICITDTLLSQRSRRSLASAQRIYHAGRERKIPVNVTDIPTLCDFTFPASHRFLDPITDVATPLQVGVTTNGQGCRLAGRIRREIVAKLPTEVGRAVMKIGRLRERAKQSDGAEEAIDVHVEGALANDEMVDGVPNRPVAIHTVTTSESSLERAQRRMRWVAQLSEYSPIHRLASLTEEGMADVLRDQSTLGLRGNNESTAPQSRDTRSRHALQLYPMSLPREGRIILVGSGPGHPSLLTIAAYTALTKLADLVLTDKLVPEGVLALIPHHVEVRVARKFPGNADGAQTEMMEAAIEAAKTGRTVVRLKQGDPIVYGRAGEEILYFRQHGFEATVIPGITSALAAPLFAGIPVTQRGVAESFTVCTGVGRQGKGVSLPGYERSRTLVVLMGVARLSKVVEALTSPETVPGRAGEAYPTYTPVAIIERASMPDQRLVASTVGDVVTAIESSGEQRPPGLIVIGYSVLALWKGGNTSILDGGGQDQTENERRDRVAVEKWLGGLRWRTIEGLGAEWGAFEAALSSASL